MLMTIWVTTRCNMKCSYCYEEKSGYKDHEANIRYEEDVLSYVIENLTDDNIIMFHGGEPLLNFKFISNAVEKIHQVDTQCKFGFTTNGTVWSDEIENFLKKYKNQFCGWISLSLDGNQINQDLSRRYKNGSSTFDDVMKNCERLRNIFSDLRIRMTVTSRNICNLEQSIDFFYNRGLKKIIPVIDIFDNGWNDSCFEVLSEQIDRLIRKYKDDRKIFIGLIEEYKNLRVKKHCTFSNNIYIDGKIYPCVYTVGDKQFVLGDIRSGVDAEKSTKWLSALSKDNVECEGCTNIRYCLYNRCKFLNYYIEGDFNVPCTVGCAYENLKYEKIAKYFQ